MFRSISVPRTRSRRPGPRAAGLLLLLALAGGRPACAMSGTIDYSYTGSFPITVGSGETLTVAANGSVDSSTSGQPAIEVEGGTLNVTGGSVRSSRTSIIVDSGAVMISGGLVNNTVTEDPAIEVKGGTLNVTGGSVQSSETKILLDSGAVTISGGSVGGNNNVGPAVEVKGGTLNVTGGSVSRGGGSFGAIIVDSGTVTLSGGSVSGGIGVGVYGGKVTLSGASILGSLGGIDMIAGTVAIVGGSVSGALSALQIAGGTATISGGSFPGDDGRISVHGGTADIVGCGLQLDVSGQLTGTLQDGTPINTSTYGLTAGDLHNLPPTFTNCPPAGTTALATCTASGVGANVSFSPLLATAPCGGTPTVGYDHQPGSFFPVGNTPVIATATDASGSSTACPFTVTVAYGWSGVQQPLNADGSSVFKAGSTVPVKFQLTGPSACISTLAATLAYSLVGPGESAPVNEAVSTSAATTGNQFRYDPTSGQYLYNWSTKGLAAGRYLLRIDLGDGGTRSVTVGLR